MRIGIHARTVHPDLWPLCNDKANGRTGAALAKKLGVGPSEVSQWVRLKNYPKFIGDDHEEKRQHIADVLLIETGKSMDELWPEDLRIEIDQKTASRDLMKISNVNRMELAESFAQRMMLPSPESEIETVDMAEAISKQLNNLPPRYAQVLRMRFGLDGNKTCTYAAIGDALGISKEWAHQIESKALRKLSRYIDPTLLFDK